MKQTEVQKEAPVLLQGLLTANSVCSNIGMEARRKNYRCRAIKRELTDVVHCLEGANLVFFFYHADTY